MAIATKNITNVTGIDGWPMSSGESVPKTLST